MNRFFVAFALVLALACSGLQAQSLILRANIPFDFWVDKNSVPAGHYELRYYANGLLQVQDVDTSKLFASVFTVPDPGRDGGRKSVLQFNRYGKSRFLARIVTPDLPSGCALMKSPQEKELISHFGTPERSLIALGRK